MAVISKRKTLCLTDFFQKPQPPPRPFSEKPHLLNGRKATNFYLMPPNSAALAMFVP
jgi:hypothetical protein